MIPIFPNGIQGLSDSLWSGVQGSASKIIGIDYRSTPGVFKAQQKLAKHSGETIDELCKHSVSAPDGSTIWFSSESGKIWREDNGSYSLVHTTSPTKGEDKCLGAKSFGDFIFWATEWEVHYIPVSSVGGDWSEEVVEGFGEFTRGSKEFHPMAQQALSMYIGDSNRIAEVGGGNIIRDPTKTMVTNFDPNAKFQMLGVSIRPFEDRFPSVIAQAREAQDTGTSLSKEVTVPVGDNKLMIVFLSAYRGDDSEPNLDDVVVDFDGDNLTDFFGVSSNLSGGDRVRTEVYALVNPGEKTANVTATFNTTLTNVVMHVLIIDGARQAVPVGGTASSSSSTQVGTGFVTFDFNEDYRLRLAFTNSETSTHDFPAPQQMVLSGSNDWGNDSMSAIGETNDLSFFPTTAFSNFSVPTRETIQALIDFDTDILIGTRVGNIANVLRWDTVSSQYISRDEIDEEGINAFIRDDNFVYAQAGSYGRLYFYNGEVLEPFKRIPGQWNPNNKAKINNDAVGFHLGVPVFGLSTVEGTPTEMGVYAFGSYSKDYPKTLALDFPVFEIFEDLEIGSILTVGADMYVSYKNGSDVGVAKLDWSNKYEHAFLETTALMPSDVRSNYSVVNGFNVDYTELPGDTDVSIEIKKKYENDFTELKKENYPDLMQIKSRVTATKIANLIMRLDLAVNDNDSPVIENVSIE